MDALMLLTADHNRVRGLFTRFRTAHENEDVSEMTALAETIFEELGVHTTIEEEIFYPAISRISEEIHETVVEGLEEHHVVKVLEQELASLAPEDEHWVAKVMVLIENVEHHAGEEEGELFPAVRRAMDAGALAELGERLETRKAQLGAPTSADKEHLTVKDLQRLAKEQEIPGRSTMDREELLATVSPG